ncbi:MAG: hypothetical protein HY002_14270 [Candidatus Rokubacteria bacterium]|nr:hypothetical protein [Candidatus Rokubacteria bacterium]
MNQRLGALLRREGAGFDVIDHRDVYTAQERAAVCHISGRALAKVGVVR